MKKRTTRSRSPLQLAERFSRRLEGAIREYASMPGIGDCFAILVCGKGKQAVTRVINPWDWEEDDLVRAVDQWLINPEKWGNGDDYKYANNVHEMASSFLGWVAREAQKFPRARMTSVLVAHPEGAATMFYIGEDMKTELVSAVARLAEERFA